LHFSLGLKELEERFRDSLQPGTLAIIVGHPGSGKTTLAVQLCHANAMDGHQSLYVSFQEDKEKLYRHMKKLGFDLEDLEKKGVFKYVRLPMMTLVDDLMKELSTLLTTDSYDVIIVDSVNALLDSVKTREEQRMILQNYFYEVSRMVKGLVVLLAEIPMGEERVNLGSIEFVADFVIILKHHVARGLLARIMEIRKARGSSLKAVEYPFEIWEGQGIRVFPPTTPEKIFLGNGTPLESSLALTKQVVPRILRGEVVYITYDPFARSPLPALLVLDLLISNNMKAIFTSYIYSEDEVLDSIAHALREHVGVPEEVALSLLKKCVRFDPLNPVGEALTSLASRTILQIEKAKPDMIIFHGVEIFSKVSDYKDYWSALVNELIWTKNNGVTNIRVGSCTPREWCEMNAAVSDIVIHVRFIDKNGSAVPIIYSWGRSFRPRTVEINEEVLTRLRSDFQGLVKKALSQ
jgi:circadian clock protein KaiC